MKVTPGNQTLILANERTAAGGSPSARLGQALNGSSTGAVLQRVTIVAARPDTTLLYLQADYSPQSDAAPPSTPGSFHAGADGEAAPDEAPAASAGALVASGAARRGLVTSAGGPRDSYGNLQSTPREAGSSSYLRPADHYARTQRILTDEPEFGHIDVHA